MAELLLSNVIDLNGSGWGPDLLRGHDPCRAAFLAGSVWHARSLLKLVSKSDLAVLVGCIGAEAHAFGIRHVAHAISTRLISDPEKLAEQIKQDGHASLGAWLDENSVLERNRVLLRLPMGTAAQSPSTEHRDAAGKLLSLVVTHLATETEVK
ncbi:nodulation protein NolU [Rhizobium grahamii]|uniref:nodulation protein NolU n=1 Tax=Rhizobium grahamii TaxID=1120045 RepID=UPI003144F32C